MACVAKLMPPVLFVMLDGVRPDAVQKSSTPTLDRLVAQGASSFAARSVMPSVTLPCHTSIFHSVPPTRHGITSNSWVPMARPIPGLIDIAAAAGKKCAFFYNWEQLRDLSRPGTLSFSHFTDSSADVDGDDGLAREAASRIPAERWDFVFLYFGTVDTAGHKHGWMSPGYLGQLERVDSLLGEVLDVLPDDYTVLVHADHGGHDRNHGTDCPEDMLVPWIATGNGIKASHTIQAPVSIMDTAPTAAHLLGIAPHPDWEGKIIEEIFLARSGDP
jgi:predicted AlkP superfamily pyrophosphatase or phosphodiesterase